MDTKNSEANKLIQSLKAINNYKKEIEQQELEKYSNLEIFLDQRFDEYINKYSTIKVDKKDNVFYFGVWGLSFLMMRKTKNIYLYVFLTKIYFHHGYTL